MLSPGLNLMPYTISQLKDYSVATRAGRFYYTSLVAPCTVLAESWYKT